MIGGGGGGGDGDSSVSIGSHPTLLPERSVHGALRADEKRVLDSTVDPATDKSHEKIIARYVALAEGGLNRSGVFFFTPTCE